MIYFVFLYFNVLLSLIFLILHVYLLPISLSFSSLAQKDVKLLPLMPDNSPVIPCSCNTPKSTISLFLERQISIAQWSLCNVIHPQPMLAFRLNFPLQLYVFVREYMILFCWLIYTVRKKVQNPFNSRCAKDSKSVIASNCVIV